MAEALYRKYRPQVFSEVVGQDHIERTIKNAIEQDKLSHAYLFCGPRGTGKTTTARLLAKALLCENGPTANPDGTCDSCQEIARGEHPDVYELDAASRTGVENVREEIISRVQFAPTRGKYKVYIIDEVHMLSVAAFNALLKTLEEPPSHVVFILCTTDPQKVPETILSRCQRFDFRRIDNQGMTDRLEQICQAEGVSCEREALEIIAGRSDGGLRNALTALEQAIAFGEGSVSVAVVQQLGGTQAACDLTEIIDALAQRNVAAAFLWVDSLAQTGGDFSRAAADLAQRVRDMYFLAVAGPQAPLSVAEEMRAQVIAQAKCFSPDRLAYMLEQLGDAMAQMRQSAQVRLCFEIALTKICHPASDITLESLAERVDALERRPMGVVAAGANVPAGAAVGAGGALGVAGAAAGAAASAPAEVTHARPATAATAAAPAGAASARAEVGAAPEGFAASVSAPVPVEEPAVQPSAVPLPAAVEAAPASVQPQTQVSARARVQAPNLAAAQAGSELAASPAQTLAVSSDAFAKKLEGFANPAVVQRLWQRCLAEIKRERPAYTSLLMSAHISYDQVKGCLSITFRSGYAFALTMLQKPEALEYLRQVVSHVAGAAVPVEVSAETAGQPEAAATQHAQAADRPAQVAEQSAQDAGRSAQEAAQPAQAAPQPAKTAAHPEEPAAAAGFGDSSSSSSVPDVRRAADSGNGAASGRAAGAPDATTHATPGWTPDGSGPAVMDDFSAQGSSDRAGAADSANDESPYAYEEVPLDAYGDFAAYDVDDSWPSPGDFPQDDSRETKTNVASPQGSSVDSARNERVAPASSETPVSSETFASPEVSALYRAASPDASDVLPWEDDPFAIPESVGPTIELDEFQQMLATSFGEGVVVQEE